MPPKIMPPKIRITYDGTYDYRDFQKKTCDFYRSLGYKPWGTIPKADGTNVLILDYVGDEGDES